MYIHIYIYIYIYMCACTRVCPQVCMCIHTRTYTYTHSLGMLHVRQTHGKSRKGALGWTTVWKGASLDDALKYLTESGDQQCSGFKWLNDGKEIGKHQGVTNFCCQLVICKTVALEGKMTAFTSCTPSPCSSLNFDHFHNSFGSRGHTVRAR